MGRAWLLCSICHTILQGVWRQYVTRSSYKKIIKNHQCIVRRWNKLGNTKFVPTTVLVFINVTPKLCKLVFDEKSWQSLVRCTVYSTVCSPRFVVTKRLVIHLYGNFVSPADFRGATYPSPALFRNLLVRVPQQPPDSVKNLLGPSIDLHFVNSSSWQEVHSWKPK